MCGCGRFIIWVCVVFPSYNSASYRRCTYLTVDIFVSAYGVYREYAVNVTFDKYFQKVSCCLTITFVNVSYRIQRSVWNLARACVPPPMNVSSTNTTCISTTVGYSTVLAMNSK